MVTFTTFNNRLPDPTFMVNDAGVVDANTGTRGPGFASVKVASKEDNQVSRTKSNRGVHVTDGAHNWEISITYNPMLRDEFDVVDTFLQSRKGRRYPFFVVLPQYSRPKSSLFSAFVNGKTFTAPSATASGSPTLLVGTTVAFSSYPRPGDFITITDAADINHLKAYKILFVETNALYQAGKTQPATNQVRLHLNPPLTRFVNAGAVVNFVDPKFRVIQKGDVIEHDLNTDNLYQFGLQLEEILP